MTKPRLHIIPTFHKKQVESNSTCAFTTKGIRFPEMMAMYGYESYMYHMGEECDAKANNISLCTNREFDICEEREYGDQDTTHLLDSYTAHLDTLHYKIFDKRIHDKLSKYFRDGDIVCHVFGVSFRGLYSEFPRGIHVETGIGYSYVWAPYQIFESYAFMHHVMGWKQEYQNAGNIFIAPNYYRKEDFYDEGNIGNYVLWANRINVEKGINTLIEIADRMPEQEFWVFGNSLEDYGMSARPNIKRYMPIKTIERKRKTWSEAMCTIMPTRYCEPFGGVHVEGMMCGTPAITSDYGVFTETITNGFNGYRCDTVDGYIDAIRNASSLDRKKISEDARSKYCLEAVGKTYDTIFSKIIGKHQ